MQPLQVAGDLGVLLDLIQDPKKYAKLFKELLDLQAEIRGEMGILKTKDQAERFLNDAQTKSNVAEAYAYKYAAEIDKNKAEAEKNRDAAKVLMEEAREMDKEAKAMMARAKDASKKLVMDTERFEVYKSEQKLAIDGSWNSLNIEKETLAGRKAKWDDKLRRAGELFA